MATLFLSFDAYGTYAAGGPIDQIIDAFDAAKVIYQHRHVHQGQFSLGYLATPRATKIIERVSARHVAERVWKLRQAQLVLVSEIFPENENLRVEFLDTFPFFTSFDVAVQPCSLCAEDCPIVLIQDGFCPECKEDA
jgi:hypothetical protein